MQKQQGIFPPQRDHARGVTTLAGIIIIVAVAVVFFGGVFAYQYFSKFQTPITNIQPNPNVQNKSEILTESDILKATYAISANFGGKRTAPQNVVLPYGDSPDRVYITENGSVLKNPTKPSGEVFWIYKYEFTDLTHTQAKVYIGANYGASGQDNRVFTAKKVNGVVSTEEIINQQINNIQTIDQAAGLPVIDSISPKSGPKGTIIEVRGQNLLGFEGDRNLWVKNSQGISGIVYGDVESTSNYIKATLSSPLCQTDESYRGLPCESWLELTPGVYKIYANPWGTKTNEVLFTIAK